MPMTFSGRARRLAVASLFAFSLAGPALAIDSTDEPAPPDIASAQEQIKGEHWDEAIVILKQIVAEQPNNADANNLLGYSLRKSGKWKDALGYYEKALEIDPNHLGANEYLGELWVEQGDLDKAKARLAVIEGVCGQTCEEYLELKAAIDGKS